MANLIITIIAIALVAVAALMGAYYGGTAFNQGQEQAERSTLMNEAAQVSAAIVMYNAMEDDTFDNGNSIADLVSNNYITSALSGWTVAADAASMTKTAKKEACALIAAETQFSCGADETTVTYTF
ncbi:MAG: hypothetical protein OIF36_00965 [Alphaproteobacteria bacterium]|nr:hypothetical protein [Alphaproteobacteria bacterium]